MTNDQAAKLQMKWKVRFPPIPCLHFKTELGRNENGDLTGTSHCLICGEEFDGPSHLLSAGAGKAGFWADPATVGWLNSSCQLHR